MTRVCPSECPRCGHPLMERIACLWLCQKCGHEWDDPPAEASGQALVERLQSYARSDAHEIHRLQGVVGHLRQALRRISNGDRDAVKIAADALSTASPAPASPQEMPRIEAGDVVDLQGFTLRPVKSVSVLQGNDGVNAVYKCVWRRAEANNGR